MPMMSNKTKSKIFFWSVVLCLLLAGTLAVMTRLYFSKNAGPVAAASRRMAAPVTGVRLDRGSGRLVAESDGARYTFTIDPRLQALAEELLRNYDPMTGAIVGIDPRTGAVRVAAVYVRKRVDYFREHRCESFLDPVARNGTYPMASVAKIVTAAAAFRAGLFEPDSVFQCNGRAETSGGNVNDAVGEMHGSISMADAFAKSCNSTFAKVALKVGRGPLLDEFNRFLFNKPIDFDLPLLESKAMFQDTDYSLARAGAGWEGAWMSPVHAAMIAASIRGEGNMPRAYLVESVNRGGKTIYRARPEIIARPVSPDVAEKIGSMFDGTVNVKGGTAYKGFYKGGKYQAGDIRVAGKTGSLNGNSDNESVTWFIGYTGSGDPDIAFATMIINDGNWTIKAASFTGQFFTRLAHGRK
jgi:cell division protein FtsI/penicillin-binding protein 2